MSDRDPFARAIRERPDDPLPRLVYADWLDENAGDTTCQTCGGSGYRGPTLADMPRVVERIGTDGRSAWLIEQKGIDVRQVIPYCPDCVGAGRVPNGFGLAAALQRVLAEPDEDRHRLAYAEAVQATDPERAEFVRVQCEAAKCQEPAEYCVGHPHPRGSDDALWTVCHYCRDAKPGLCRYHALRRREGELLSRHGEWYLNLPNRSWRDVDDPLCRYDPGCLGRQWRRGFIEVVECTAADFFRHAEAITDATPLREVRFTQGPEVLLVPDPANPIGYLIVSGLPDVERTVSDREVLDIRPQLLHVAQETWLLEMLALKWPRIKFTLPAPGQPYYATVTPNDFARDVALVNRLGLLAPTARQPLGLAGAVGGVAERPDGH